MGLTICLANHDYIMHACICRDDGASMPVSGGKSSDHAFRGR